MPRASRENTWEIAPFASVPRRRQYDRSRSRTAQQRRYVPGFTSTINSISTGMLSGSSFTPTDVRA